MLSFSIKVSAPTWTSIILPRPVPIEPYKNLIFATAMVETECDTMAYNPLENAAGIFQIRPVKLIDYNKRTGSTIGRKDLFDYNTSEKIFLYFAEQIGPYNIEKIARRWNGSGELTTNYWNRIKRYL
jgi:hypothetical protein